MILYISPFHNNHHITFSSSITSYNLFFILSSYPHITWLTSVRQGTRDLQETRVHHILLCKLSKFWTYANAILSLVSYSTACTLSNFGLLPCNAFYFRFHHTLLCSICFLLSPSVTLYSMNMPLCICGFVVCTSLGIPGTYLCWRECLWYALV